MAREKIEKEIVYTVTSNGQTYTSEEYDTPREAADAVARHLASGSRYSVTAMRGEIYAGKTDGV